MDQKIPMLSVDDVFTAPDNTSLEQLGLVVSIFHLADEKNAAFIAYVVRVFLSLNSATKTCFFAAAYLYNLEGH